MVESSTRTSKTISDVRTQSWRGNRRIHRIGWKPPRRCARVKTTRAAREKRARKGSGRAGTWSASASSPAWGSESEFVRYVVWGSLTAAAAAALAAAVLAHDDPASSWRRAGLIALGIALLVLLRQLGRVAWPDVAVLVAATLAFAALATAATDSPDVEHTTAVLTPFVLPSKKILLPPIALPAQAKVAVIALTPDRAVGKAATEHKSSRYVTTLLTPVPA